MQIELRPVEGRLARHRFVDVPFRLYRDDPDWIPPLRLSVLDRISPKHPAHAVQDWKLWIAYSGKQPVGRIGACIDHTFNRVQDKRWGWVGFFDCIDDQGVAAEMFDAATGWAKSQGAETCVGPASFTLNDECGLLVDNFDTPPYILTTENPRYYEGLWTAAGWQPAMDLWAWRFTRDSTGLSERQHRVLERLKERQKVTVRVGNMKEFDAEVSRLFEVYNAAWSANWGFSPLTEPEVRHLAKQVKPMVDPNLVLFAEDDAGQTLGVCIGLPDANIPMGRVRSGRLLPLGWFHLLRGLKRPTRARVWALGIKPDAQARALGPLLYGQIIDNLAAIPTLVEVEASWTLATNDLINDAIGAMGAEHYKTWRMFERPT